eukprot:scaffold1232_cov127-Isochrysis_galbana.AAC.1
MARPRAACGEMTTAPPPGRPVARGIAPVGTVGAGNAVGATGACPVATGLGEVGRYPALVALDDMRRHR